MRIQHAIDRMRMWQAAGIRRLEGGHLIRAGRYVAALAYHCVRRLRTNNALATSAALSFRTIFALVPAIVLVFLVVRSFGVADTRTGVRQLLARIGFAQIAVMELAEEVADGGGNVTGDEAAFDPWAPQGALGIAAVPVEAIQRRRVSLAEKLEEVVSGVERQVTFGRVGPIGVLLLIWSAMTLMTTMERGLNRIFGAPHTRPLGRRVLLYWTILTLGPVLLTAAVYAGRQATLQIEGLPVLSWLVGTLGWLGSVIVGILLLTLLYKLLPNTRVNPTSALVAAILAVSLWLVAKWGFGVYLDRVAGSHLYGALGLLPLFLIWVNLSWWIFLFGAELAHTAASLNELRQAAVDAPPLPRPVDLLAAALVVARAYWDGAGPIRRGSIASRLRLPDRSVRLLLDRLQARRVVLLVGSDDDEAYILARPAERVEVFDVLDIDRPEGEEAALGEAAYEPQIAAAVAALGRRTRSAMGRLTLAQLLSESVV